MNKTVLFGDDDINVNLYVSVNDTNVGQRNDANHCPFARALKRELHASNVAVHDPLSRRIPASVVVTEKRNYRGKGGGRWEGDLSAEARDFISSFDAGDPVVTQIFPIRLHKVLSDT